MTWGTDLDDVRHSIYNDVRQDNTDMICGTARTLLTLPLVNVSTLPDLLQRALELVRSQAALAERLGIRSVAD